MPTAPRTLLDKLWDPHVVHAEPDGRTLLFIDRHLFHDGSFQAFARLREKGLPVIHPELALATPDHYAPTDSRSVQAVKDPAARRVLGELEANTRDFRLRLLPMGDGREGIVHVVGPEQGFTLPGVTLVCGDSHTSTHGALGALAFGIGASEVAHVLATQCLWQVKPKAMRIVVTGRLAPGVFAKDLALAIIARIGMAGAVGHAVEYAGEAIEALSIEERCTLCNMTIEAGGRMGFVAPDETTIAYLRGRPMAPKAERWDEAVAEWRLLASDPGARFDREVTFDASEVRPMVTWGTSVEQAIAIDGAIPEPAAMESDARRENMRQALDYMGLAPGQTLRGAAVDQVFIGSCTNGRLSDLRAAAEVVRRAGGEARVPTLVSPGSAVVKAMAEAEGLDRVFTEAGMRWAEPGCSMCVGMNGDIVAPGKRCVSTSNRNFPGRQGRDSRTHLASPATAAATAMAGVLTDALSVGGGSHSPDRP
jgi:3-isopropylmalate/(R)-2-methylmalate dehydratase large subunit